MTGFKSLEQYEECLLRDAKAADAEGSDVLVTVQGAPRGWTIGVNVSAA